MDGSRESGTRYYTQTKGQRILNLIRLVAEIAFVVLVIFLFIQLDNEKSARIQQTDQKLHNLACTIVSFYPSDIAPIVKGIRDQYHCPPYSGPPIRRGK